MAKGILIAAMDFSDVAEDEFHDWYDAEHIPERLRVPGFLNAERWIGAQNPKVSLALYDLETVGVLHSPAYQAVGGANGTPWTKRVTGRTKSLIRLEGEQVLPGDALAPHGAAALLLISPSTTPLSFGTKRSGSNVPERSSSYSRRKRSTSSVPNSFSATAS